MIEVAKKTITIFFENKKLVGDSKQSNKRRSEKKKKRLKNTLLRWILQSILENQAFQRISKLIMVSLYEMDSMKSIATFVKIDEMYKFLKSASHCLLIERWRWNQMMNAGVCLWTFGEWVGRLLSFLVIWACLTVGTVSEKNLDDWVSKTLKKQQSLWYHLLLSIDSKHN